MTSLIVNDALERKRKGERVVDNCTEKDYICCGKKVNKNVWELQQLYETTQAKTTKVLPEFFERIRFMIVKGITKANFSGIINQQGELFNYVVEDLLRKIVPTIDPITHKLKTKYDKTKTNVGAYILNSCYWSVIAYQTREKHHESLVSCGDFMEDYEKVSDAPQDIDISQLKLISSYDQTNSYMPIIREVLKGDED